MRNTIWKLYNAVSALVRSTRDTLAERLESIRETISLLYNRMMENIEYGRKRLKGIVQKEAEEETKGQEQEEEEEAKEQQQNDDEQYDTVAKIKLVHEGKRVKEVMVTGNLNKSNTKMIMANITPHNKMRAKVIYSFK